MADKEVWQTVREVIIEMLEEQILRLEANASAGTNRLRKTWDG